MKQTSVYLIFMIVCACATPYKSSGILGGFTDTQLSDSTFMVSFNGNGYTSTQRAIDFCLLRCADLSTMNGYKYFIIIDNKEGASYSAYSTPQNSTTTGKLSTSGNTTTASFNTITTGGETYWIGKPGIRNTIICFNQISETGNMVYDADFLIKSIRTKYKMNENSN